MQIWVRWMLCQRGGALPNVGKEPGRGGGKRRKKTTKCGLKMKAPISRRLLICAVVGIGAPFFDPKGEGMA